MKDQTTKGGWLDLAAAEEKAEEGKKAAKHAKKHKKPDPKPDPYEARAWAGILA